MNQLKSEPAKLGTNAPLFTRMRQDARFAVGAQRQVGRTRADDAFRRVVTLVAAVVAVRAEFLRAALLLVRAVAAVGDAVAQLRHLDAARPVVAKTRRVETGRRLGKIITISVSVKQKWTKLAGYFRSASLLVGSVGAVLTAVTAPHIGNASGIVGADEFARPTRNIDTSGLIRPVNAVVL